MRFNRFSPFLASVFCLSLLAACGDDVDDNEFDEDERGDTDEQVINCAVLEDGAPCGSATVNACDGADTCRNGQCQHNYAAVGTACGETTAGACDAADTCNGAGTCLPNHFPDGTACGEIVDTVCNPLDTCASGVCQTRFAASGTPCGDPTQVECNAADTCNGAGACVNNHAVDGTLCGDPANTTCNPADTCVGGACEVHLANVNSPCGDPNVTECDLADTCDALGSCLPNYVDATTPCGDPSVTECDLADTCDGSGACGLNYVTAGTPCGSSTSSQCNAADTCSAGACLINALDEGLTCYDCAAGAGSCTTCNTAVCGDRTQYVCIASGALNASSNAGNNHRGNMFDLVAKENIIIRSFDASPMSNTTIAIYTRPGTFNGFGGNSNGWTLLGSAPVNYTGGFAAVPVPVNVTIRAGETQAFYVTSTNQGVSLNYSNGSSQGALYSEDANLEFHEGVGLEYPFSSGTNAFYSPRVWNGAIHYDVADDIDTTGATYDNAVAQGAMFDVVGIAKADIGGIAVELVTGTHDVDVYFRRGTFVGNEGSSTGWEQIGAIGAVDSLGGGALTHVSFSDRIEIEAGETISFYVDTEAANQLRTTAGGAVGDVAATNTRATLQVGTPLGGTFSAAGDPAAIRAVLETSPCDLIN